MIQASRIADNEVLSKRINFKIHQPVEEVENAARWSINGFPAKIVVWTAEEWDRLVERPNDAQQVPNGLWCALRMD